MNWQQLNIIDSPGISPPTGPEDSTLRTEDLLSNPVSHAEVLAQLEAWTNINFDLENPLPDMHQQQPSTQQSFAPAFHGNASASLVPANLPLTGPFNSFVHGAISAQDRLGRVKARSYEKGFANSTTTTSDVTVHPAAVVGSSSTASVIPTTTTPVFPAFDDSALLEPFSAGLPNSASVFPSFPFTQEDASNVTSLQSIDSPDNSISSNAATPAPASTTSLKRSTSAKSVTKSVARKKLEALPVDAPQEERDSLENAVALEEDKRRRNTAASARFRVKKKEREQAMAKTTKDLTDRVAELEKEVDSLRKENGWLRGLIVEKSKPGGGKATPSLESSPESTDVRPAKRARKEQA